MAVKSFNILNYIGSDHINVLSEDRSQLVCQCPVCGGSRMTIDKRNGAYQCWSGGCECKDIREAIAPWSEKQKTQSGERTNSKPKGKPRKPKAPSAPEGKLHLAMLASPATDIPTPEKAIDPKHGDILRTTYVYSLTPEGELERWVLRLQWSDANKTKGYDKTFRQCHRSSSGETVWGKGDEPWEPYRFSEFLDALKATQDVPVGLVQEGEASVVAAVAGGRASTTFQGSSWRFEDMEASLRQIKSDCPSAVLAYLRDNDAAGLKKANHFKAACDQVGIFCSIIDPTAIHPGLNDKGDIVQILEAMKVPDFIRKLEEELHKSINSHGSQAQSESSSNTTQSEVKTPDFADDAADVIELFSQTAFEALYTYWPWICVNNVLYCWSESQTYYKESPDVVERRRIAEFCNTYPVLHKTPNGDICYKYAYATPEWVERVLKWVKIRLAIRSELANPAGLNCTNGVLQIIWNGSVPSWQLVDHDPKVHYYTYEPQVTFDPSADPADCDRLLAALDKPEQEVFLRIIAASLDLATVRQYKGRLIRAVLAKGYGNNGKDSLREIVSMMYGRKGMTSATLTDFAQYDSGRKFPLANLVHSRVNWASENANTAKLDTIQSLKAFVTGDPIDSERKGKDEQSFNPVGIAIFNINDPPSVQASLEAITSRYAVLSFNKTFKIGADPSKGEVEADPRFKYDPTFLKTKVLPSFLNRVLGALVNLMNDGINYSCTEKAMQDIQAQNSHLFQFCQDVGLQYDPAFKLTAGEIWQRLEEWYIANGTLTYEETSAGKKKAFWIDQARKGDANVRGANQVIARFQSLFPKTNRVTITSGPDKNRMALLGIGFKAPDNPGNPPDNPLPPLPPSNPPDNPDTPENATQVSQLPYQVSQSVSQLESPKHFSYKDCSESGKAGKPVLRQVFIVSGVSPLVA